LQAFLPLLTESVAVVTASPYHPLGGVVNVPRWRLFLSRGASRLYGLLLRNKLHTYTSCFRVYRKSAVEDVQIQDGRFLGITEILWQLDRRGARIVECPAMLEVRVLGASKLKTLRGIAAHLKLLSRIAWHRLVDPQPAPMPPRTASNAPNQKEVLHVNTHDHSNPPHAAV
jgi:hypothetical protein